MYTLNLKNSRKYFLRNFTDKKETLKLFRYENCANCNKYSTKIDELRQLLKIDKTATNEDFESKDKIYFNIHKLNTDVRKKGTYNFKMLKQTLELIDNFRTINSQNALMLLRCTGSICIDLFPHERQNLLNHLFHLFPKYGAKYNTLHLHAFMRITLENKSYFDVDAIINYFEKNSFDYNYITHECILKQLCMKQQFNDAHDYLNRVIQSTNRLNTRRYKETSDIYKQLSTDLINPFIRGYFLCNNENEAVSMFKKIVQLKLKPNQETYYELINGYLILNKYDKAYKLLKNSDATLQNIHLLKLYEKVVKIKASIWDNANNSEKENTLNLLNKMLIQFINCLDRKNDISLRIDSVNSIIDLLQENLVSEAFYLLETLYRSEYTEEDPDKIDINKQKVDVSSYFCKYLIKTEQNVNTILKYQSKLDKSFTKNQLFHLKELTYHALDNCKEDLSLVLFEKLKLNNVNIRDHFFFPLVVNYFKIINLNSSKIADKGHDYDYMNSNEWKSLKKLFFIMVNEYNLLSNYSIENFLDVILRSFSNHNANNDFYKNVITLFPLKDNSSVIEIIAKLYIKRAIKDLTMLNDVTDEQKMDLISKNIDFLYELFNKYEYIFKTEIAARFLVYVFEIDSLNLFGRYLTYYSDFNNNLLRLVINQIKLFNRLNIELNEPFRRLVDCFLLFYCKHKFIHLRDNDINENKIHIEQFLNFFLHNGVQFSYSCLKEIKTLTDSVQNDKSSSETINYILAYISNIQTNDISVVMNGNSNLVSKDLHNGLQNDKLYHGYQISQEKWSQDTINDLEALIIALKNENKNIYPTMRRLLNLLCNQDKLLTHDEYSKKNIQLIQKLEMELPIAEFNLSSYASLIFYHSKYSRNFEKANAYFENLLSMRRRQTKVDENSTSLKNPNNYSRIDLSAIDPFKIVTYIQLLIDNNVPFLDIIQTIENIKYPKSYHYMKRPMNDFFNTNYKTFNALQLKTLSDAFQKNNYCPDVSHVNRVIITKLINENQLDLAIQEFYFAMKNDKIVCEIDLLRELLKRSNYNIGKNEYIYKLLNNLKNTISPEYAYNCLLISLVQLNQFDKAEAILDKNLDSKFNLKQLELYLFEYLQYPDVFETNLKLTLLFLPFTNFSKCLDESQINQIKQLLSSIKINDNST